MLVCAEVQVECGADLALVDVSRKSGPGTHNQAAQSRESASDPCRPSGYRGDRQATGSTLHAEGTNEERG